jgi:transcriptional regulator with AAA-type ATPase domain
VHLTAATPPETETMGTSETTAPLQSVAQNEAGGPPLAVRWVHPVPDGPETPLTSGRLVVGRGDRCHLRLDGDGVSRHHAEFLVTGRTLGIRDLDSKNGVHVNGVRCAETELRAGDVVRLGDCVGLVVHHAALADHPAFGEVFPGLLAGPGMRWVLNAAKAAAPTDLPVVIEGETGTGKERVARALHGWSGRPGPFVAINCAAIPEALAEAELFGYRKGAFTGAERASEGQFRAAHRGTLLLDELVDLPLRLQAKVLRAIELREVVPLGESRPVPVDVRIVSAAQAPLQAAVEAGRFRADLLARLDGLTLRLPPLRQRPEEVPFLFRRIAARHGVLPPLDARLVESLCVYDWPFNVRELELLARRVVALHAAETMLRPEHLPDRMRAPRAAPRPPGPDDAPAEASARRTPADDARDLAALVEALRRQNGNVARAATEVGISRPRAYRLMQGAPELDLDGLRSGRTSD